MEFTEEQLERYSRQILLPGVGPEGQERISSGKVLIVGAGGLGAPAALYLAAAGVGTLGLADGDVVEVSNLQRQILHFTPDLGRPKVASAEEKLRALNPHVRVVAHGERARADNVADLIAGYDFVIDGTDNFPSKFLVNDACVLAGKPFSHAGILRFQGQTLTHVPGRACFRCVFPSMPPKGAVPSCSQGGILGAVAGILGTIQAAEALKFLAGVGELLSDRLLVFDALKTGFRTVRVSRNPSCPVCGPRPSITRPVDEEAAACDLGSGRRGP